MFLEPLAGVLIRRKPKWGRRQETRAEWGVYELLRSRRFRLSGALLQAGSVEGECLHFAFVSLCLEFLTVEFKIQAADVAGSDYDLLLRFDRFLRALDQDVLHDLFA